MTAIPKVIFGLAMLMAAQTALAAADDPAEDAVGEERAQLARIHEQNDEFNLAVEQYEKAVDEIELVDGQFSERLIEPLAGLGHSYLALGEHELAEEALKRAQHLTHRNKGVHSMSQVPVLDVLTENFLQKDQPLQADKQQKLALFISEHQYGKSSPELVPALYKLGDWYMGTGQFRDGNSMRALSTLSKATAVATIHDYLSHCSALPKHGDWKESAVAIKASSKAWKWSKTTPTSPVR